VQGIGLKTFVKLILIFSLASSSALAADIANARGATAHDYLLDDDMIEHAGAVIQVRTYGKSADVGEYVAIIPSLGRGADDYTEKFGSTITTRLVENGFRVVLIQPRGVGRSTGDLTPANASMSVFAQDIKAVLDARGIEKVNLIGHAFGNRLARTFATLYPSYVDDLVLLASGGNFEMNDGQKACLRNSFNLKLDDKTRLEAIQCAFFAEGNDPRVWLDGWYPRLAQAQVLAATMINTDFYKRAGGKQFMIVQATEDFIAPPDKAGKALKAELGDQVTYVEVKRAGHALSSEQPDQVSKYILEYFGRGTANN
jgi:pimeloyl-ACP methyl ester carboxylesterase